MTADQIAIGQIKSFRGGWASLTASRSQKPHFYELVQEFDPKTPNQAHAEFKSLCGIEGYITDRLPALVVGTFKRCVRCEKLKQ